MNIFVINMNPFESAKQLCDAHVIKMILESCQLLSTQDRLHSLTDERYKITHVNHPCRKCLDNDSNYIWLKYHLYGLLKEYTYRYGKIHKCQNLYEKYWKRSDDELLYSKKINFVENYSELIDTTTFPQCMPIQFKNDSTDICNVVKAYKNYYSYKQKTLPSFTYKIRTKPEWLI